MFSHFMQNSFQRDRWLLQSAFFVVGFGVFDGSVWGLFLVFLRTFVLTGDEMPSKMITVL